MKKLQNMTRKCILSQVPFLRKKKKAAAISTFLDLKKKNQIFIMFFCPFAGSQKIAWFVIQQFSILHNSQNVNS